MGYFAQPFAVDIQKVKDAFGSKDQLLLDKAKKTELYETYESQYKVGEYDKCLEDIIFNYVQPADRKESTRFFGLIKSKEGSGLMERPHVYGYALIAICEVLGTFLANEGDIFHTGEEFTLANKFLEEKGFKITMERFWHSEKIFDIPAIPDFPVINSFSKEEIRYLYGELLKLNLEKAKFYTEIDEEQEILLIYFRDKLKVCIDSDTQWLSFTH